MAETTNGKFDDYVHEDSKPAKFNAADHFGNVPNSEHPRDLDQHPGVTADIRPVGQETSIVEPRQHRVAERQQTTHDIAVSAAERVIDQLHDSAKAQLLTMRNDIDEVLQQLDRRAAALSAHCADTSAFLEQAMSMKHIFGDALRQLRQGLESKAR